MIVDKKLRSVKCVQTLSRLNRIHPEKKDTFVLDFVNTVDEIRDAFQPFYQETTLVSEVNVDKIYTLQKELREYQLYSDNDILAFSSIYFSKKKQDEKMMGQMASALKPIADRYNLKSDDDRYNFRRQVRSFVKWYGYISQVCRMFDKDMHKEYVFLSYLIKLLPEGKKTPLDLDGALKLEFYKLEKTFKGDIVLDKVGGEYEPAKGKGTSAPEKKTPLDEIIEMINELYGFEKILSKVNNECSFIKMCYEDESIVGRYSMLVKPDNCADLVFRTTLLLFMAFCNGYNKFFDDDTTEEDER